MRTVSAVAVLFVSIVNMSSYYDYVYRVYRPSLRFFTHVSFLYFF